MKIRFEVELKESQYNKHSNEWWFTFKGKPVILPLEINTVVYTSDNFNEGFSWVNPDEVYLIDTKEIKQ